jgi:hypothetical protein
MPNPANPTPEQIKARTAQIRASWTPAETIKRMGTNGPGAAYPQTTRILGATAGSVADRERIRAATSDALE